MTKVVSITKKKFHASCFRIQDTRGFTVLEILISVSVIAMIVAISASAFARFNKRQELNIAVDEVISVLEEARSFTLASKGDIVYSAHFDLILNEITLFRGSSYSSLAPDNEVTKLSSRVMIATTSFAGGGQDVVFERLTGKTNNSGTIELSFISDSTASTTIIVHPTGVIE